MMPDYTEDLNGPYERTDPFDMSTTEWTRVTRTLGDVDGDPLVQVVKRLTDAARGLERPNIYFEGDMFNRVLQVVGFRMWTYHDAAIVADAKAAVAAVEQEARRREYEELRKEFDPLHAVQS